MSPCRFCGAELQPIPPEIFFPGLREYLCGDCFQKVTYKIRHEILETLKMMGLFPKKALAAKP